MKTPGDNQKLDLTTYQVKRLWDIIFKAEKDIKHICDIREEDPPAENLLKWVDYLQACCVFGSFFLFQSLKIQSILNGPEAAEKTGPEYMQRILQDLKKHLANTTPSQGEPT